MQVSIVDNALAGKGRSSPLAAAIAGALSAEGIRSRIVSIRGTGAGETLVRESDDAVIAVGGDGTFRAVLAPAMERGVPVCPVPAGTENLFARDAGVRAEPEFIAHLIRRNDPRPTDVGELDGAFFAVMASCGPDASVIHRLHARRDGPITRWTYVRPITRELLSPALPVLTVRVDGSRWIDGRGGMLVVSNSRYYGMGINPSPDAIKDDGLLDAVFIPGTTSVRVARRLFQLRRGGSHRSLVRMRGARFDVESRGDAPWQADGEWERSRRRATILVRAGALRLIAPRPA